MVDPRRLPSARSAVAGVLSILAACSHRAAEPAHERSLSPIILTSTPPKPPPTVRPAQPAAANDNGAPFFAGTLLLQDDVLHQLGNARALALRPVGSTSTVFRGVLDAPLKMALKLATRERPHGARAEIAAYRLARLLGLNNVPPALPRRVTKSELYGALEPTSLWQWPDIEWRLLVGGSGYVHGAAIYWIEGMRDLGLEPTRERERVSSWLRFGAEAPPGQQLLASQLSTQFAFDYLIGNWDRWSGGNVQGDASGEHLYMRDNDSAFAPRLSEALQRRLFAPLQETQLYSRRFVLALRDLTRPQFEQALRGGGALGGEIELDPRAIAGLFDRRAALLSHLAALIEQHSEARVLAYP